PGVGDLYRLRGGHGGSLLALALLGGRSLLLRAEEVFGLPLLVGHVAGADDEGVLELVAVGVLAADLDHLVPAPRSGLELWRHRVRCDLVVTLLGYLGDGPLLVLCSAGPLRESV